MLFVGTLFNRRRLPDLIAAFALATRDIAAARLVVVGGDRTWPPQDLPAVATQHGVGDRVEFRSYAGDDELNGLYQRASVFAFLSEYEGFGMTPLEAMSADVPAVVLDTPLPERSTETQRSLPRPATSPARPKRFAVSCPIRQPRPASCNRRPRFWRAIPGSSAADRTLEHLERIAAR